MKRGNAKIYCRDLNREILTSQCYDSDEPVCKTCKEKPSQRNVEKYRKRYTYIQRKNFKAELNTFYDRFRNANKKSKIDGIKFLINTLASNTYLKELISAKPIKLRDMLLQLADEGADISVIHNNLKRPDIPEYLKNGHPVAWQLYEGYLSPEWNQKIEAYKKKKKVFKNKIKSIKGAISQITSLEPVPEKANLYNVDKDELSFLNAKLREAQEALRDFERVSDKYFEVKSRIEGLIGYPAKWGLPISKLLNENFKEVKLRSPNILNLRFVRIKKELMKLPNYTENEAHKTIAKLFKLAIPHLCSNLTSKQVEDRCNLRKI